MNTVRTLSLALLFAASGLFAQNEVQVSSYAFSEGVYPTFSFLFEGTDVKYVESFWKDELKKISASVSTKKEVIGISALVPQVSPDTVRIYMTAEQRKGSPMLTAHVAILTTAGFVGPNSEAQVFDAARAFVQQRSNDLRRQLAQQELTDAEKGLGSLQNELANLERDKERAAASIEKSDQRAAEAAEDQIKHKGEAEELKVQVTSMENELAANPDPDRRKDLDRLLRDQKKAEDDHRRAQDTERDMTRKSEDLATAIKKNEQEQVVLKQRIEEQTTLVKALQEKLSGIK
jgi:hypothetical protein